MATDLVDKFISELNKDTCIRQSGIMSPMNANQFVKGWFNDNCKKFYKSKIGPVIFVSNGYDFSVFFAHKPWLGTALDNLNHFFEKKSESKLNEAKAFLKARKNVISFYKKVNKPLFYSKSTKAQLASTIRKAVLFSQETLASSAFCEALDDELLLKIFSDNNVSEKKAKDLTELAKKSQFESISLTTDKGLLNHKSVNDIQWLFTTYYSTPKFSELNKKIELGVKDKGGKNKLSFEVKKITKEIKVNKKEFGLVRKNLSEKERIILDFALFNMRIRDERIEPIKKSMTILFNSIFEYSKRIGLNEKFVPFLFVEEILDKKNSVKDLENIANSRKSGVIVFISQNEMKSSSIDYLGAIKKMDEFMHKGVNVSELKGSVANKGFAKGVVKIILNEKDFSKFNEGDILVASMTRIEYVPLMKKAGAIVTDEGGITCHAAIVSRELNKPCMIGTKISTRVLKDGDLVEVDANKGVVKVLPKVVFEKKYTRDYSLIIEEAWSASFLGQLKHNLGWENPNSVHGLYYLNNSVVEVWENDLATNWVMDKVLEENNKGIDFIKKVSNSHKNDLVYFAKNFNNKKFVSAKELTEYFKWVNSAMVNFTLMYLSAIDLRTPSPSKNIAVELREKDSFFEDVNRIIRKGIIDVYPKFNGVENALVSFELISPPTLIELKEREKGFVTIPNIVSKKTNLDEFVLDFKNYLLNFEKVSQSVSNELKGQIAFKGIAIGIVKILFTKSQVSEVKEGEVIVSPMTTPDMVPAMKKAIAIVCDEGGITSHAAIIARELKIPCIVGCKIATKVLRDGDLIEVNADSGIVKVLK